MRVKVKTKAEVVGQEEAVYEAASVLISYTPTALANKSYIVRRRKTQTRMYVAYSSNASGATGRWTDRDRDPDLNSLFISTSDGCALRVNQRE